MKKVFTIFSALILINFTQLQAQGKEQIAPKNYTVAMDSLLRFVNKNDLKTAMLYDRVVANANLLSFNDRDSKQTHLIGITSKR